MGFHPNAWLGSEFTRQVNYATGSYPVAANFRLRLLLVNAAITINRDTTLAAAIAYELPEADGYAPIPITFPDPTYNAITNRWEVFTSAPASAVGVALQYDHFLIVADSGVTSGSTTGRAYLFEIYGATLTIPAGETTTIPVRVAYLNTGTQAGAIED